MATHDEQQAHDERQAYIDDMVRARGYVLDYHKALVANDLPVMRAANDLIEAAYLAERTLDRRTKELLLIVSLVIMRAPRQQLHAHMRAALEHGATAREVLEALELTLPEAGVVVFQEGFDAWCEVVDCDRIEPSDGIG